MSIWRAKVRHRWDAVTRQRAEALLSEVATWPGVRVSLTLRRPVAMRGRTVFVAAHASGLAFRTATVVGERARGLVVRGMVLLPASRRAEWAQAARAAYDEAR